MKLIPCVVLAILATSCDSLPKPSSRVQEAIDLARGLGDAVLRAKGFAELSRSIPELAKIIDKNSDSIISLEEVEGFLASAAADPKSVGLLIGTLVLLRK